MYIDYSAWETFEYTLNTLQLDLKNPRINYHGKDLNQTQIMQFLIDNEKVYELAKKISEEGYFIGEEPIICFEQGKKVVLEGNRRTSALKLLQNPKKYLPTTKANILVKNCIKNNFPVNKKVRCYIAPNRILANPIIYSRHRGETLKKWETGNQYSFIADMYYKDGLSIEDICELVNESSGKIKNYLKAYNLFYEAQQLFLAERGEFIEISNFDITNLERFYSYEPGRDFLGIDFSDDDASLIINISTAEFEKRLLFIFEELFSSSGFSRVFNSERQKREYVDNLRKNPKFDFNANKSSSPKSGKSTAERKSLDAEKAKTTIRRKKVNRSIVNFVIPRDYYISFDNEKLDLLFDELKLLPIERHYSFAILIRTYLEQVLYHYIQKQELNNKITEKSNEQRKKNGLAKVKTLIAFIKGKYNVSEELDVDRFMEILKFDSNKEYVNSLKTMLDYIKNHELPILLSDANKLRSITDYIENVKNGLDLAVHNIDYTIDLNVNKRAWNTLEPLFAALSNNLNRV